jgi:hypothetical protein
MRHIVAALVLLAACGKDSVSPPPPPPPPPPVIVKLIMAPDTGFWRGSALRLPGLVRGAVTDQGDTVAAPAVTWTLPTSFVRQGDSVLATREARGALRASFGSTVLDSTVTATMDDLSAPGKVWSGGYRCYGGTWDATRTTDTVIYMFHSGVVHYSVAPWKDAAYQADFAFDSVTQVAYLSDGSVDTVTTGIQHTWFQQDTLSLSVIASSDTVPMRKPVDEPNRYTAEAAICTVGTGWQKDGTAWELTSP